MKLLLLKSLISGGALLLLMLSPRWPEPRFLRALERRVAKLATNRELAVLTVLLVALGARLALLPLLPIPVPGVHDEYSYLLMADTFAHGRLTNTTHPMWQHFETFHEIQQPTYCSKFFPAQGFFLALGQIAFGHPFWGVWLSTGLMCAAICWALQGWMPPDWALLGAMLVTVRLGVFSYWNNSYLGGSVAALGGALVLGAFPRIKRQRRVAHAIVLAMGLGILANSRPYEGFWYSLPALVALGIWFVREAKEGGVFNLGLRIVVPAAVVLAIVVAAMAYYFWRTTGNPTRTPYSVYSAQYDIVPPFVWQHRGPVPGYRFAVMRNFYETFALPQYIAMRSSPAHSLLSKFFDFWRFFIGPELMFALLALIYAATTRKVKNSPKLTFLLIIASVGFCSSLLVVFFNLHYVAPMIPALFAVLLFCLRSLWVWNRRNAKGRMAVRLLVGASLASTLVAGILELHGVGNKRSLLLDRLQRNSGKQLVIVRYSATHNAHEEAVYNAANIDDAQVVWAREMGTTEDAALVAYFKNRRVWIAEPDSKPPLLVPYLPSTASAAMQLPSQKAQ